MLVPRSAVGQTFDSLWRGRQGTELGSGEVDLSCLQIECERVRRGDRAVDERQHRAHRQSAGGLPGDDSRGPRCRSYRPDEALTGRPAPQMDVLPLTLARLCLRPKVFFTAEQPAQTTAWVN